MILAIGIKTTPLFLINACFFTSISIFGLINFYTNCLCPFNLRKTLGGTGIVSLTTFNNISHIVFIIVALNFFNNSVRFFDGESIANFINRLYLFTFSILNGLFPSLALLFMFAIYKELLWKLVFKNICSYTPLFRRFLS